jgi:hypothetical protein
LKDLDSGELPSAARISLELPSLASYSDAFTGFADIENNGCASTGHLARVYRFCRHTDFLNWFKLGKIKHVSPSQLVLKASLL